MIKLLKLTTNEEVICELVDVSQEDQDFVTIKNAVTIVYKQVGEGLSSGFSPFMPHSEGDIQLNANCILAIGVLHPDVLNSYNNLFSNIIVPTQKIVI